MQTEEFVASLASVEVSTTDASMLEDQDLEKTSQMQEYKVMVQLRRAIYGDILLCEKTKSESVVVIKRLFSKYFMASQSVIGFETLENAQQEFAANFCLSQFGAHPHIVNCHHAFYEQECLHLVMDYCPNGDLHSYLEKMEKCRVPVSQAWVFFTQIVDGLYFMYQNDIAHRDISLENVLLDADLNCKICDFGLSVKATAETNEKVGKPYYIAPEVYNEENYDPMKADVWSLGVVLFIMITGSPVYENADPSSSRFKLLAKYGVGEVINIWKMNDFFTPETLDILSQMLQMDPSKRISIEDLYNLPCIQEYISEEKD